MNAITPAKEIPPDHRTAASGTLPTEQTKLSTAISGPATTFQSVGSRPESLVRNRSLKKSSPSSAMKPASRNPSVISFQSICQSARKLCATSDQASAESSRSRQRKLRARGVVLVPRGRMQRVRPRLVLLPARYEQAQQQRHQHDHHDPADVFAERELPADQDPQDEAELPDEVRRGELEGEREAAEAPFWKRLFAIAIAA